ncbi:MAG: amino acid permease [Chlamydiae bacterium]|nr:amino acid permease [Chlamydiota bacterium]
MINVTWGFAILGLIWWKKGNTLAISFTKESFFPAISSNKNIAYLTNVLFGLMGLEMAATHSREMINPKKDYPRSLAISVGIILFSIITSSLAVSVVIPPSDLNLVTGAMQAFSVFFNSLQIPWGIPILAGCIILGGVSGISAWIIGPTKGLMVASEDGSLPKCLSKKNRWGVPSNLLLLQAGLVSILCLAFVIYPTVNSSFWILSVITAQLALVVYIFLYLAAFKLHFSKSQVPRPFRIPGGKWGVGICASLGCLSSVVVCILGFIPPEAVSNEGVISYEISIISGMLVAIGIPLFIIKKMSKKKNKLS